MTSHEHREQFRQLTENPSCTQAVIHKQNCEFMELMLHSYIKQCMKGIDGKFLIQVENGVITFMDAESIVHFSPAAPKPQEEE